MSRRTGLAAALLLLTAVVYLPALQAGFIWDDDAYVTANPALRTLDGLGRIWTSPSASPQYYPLVFSTFWLEHKLWGFNPLGYHAVNVLLHAATALALWRLLGLLALPGGWLAAAVFAVHPLNVESVAWVAERKNVLSGLLAAQAALAYLRWRGLGEGAPEAAGAASPRNRWWLVSLGWFVLALLAKSVVAVLPVVLGVLVWWRAGRLSRGDWGRLALMAALGAGAGLCTAWLEVAQVGARGGEWSLTPVERLLVAGRSSVFYASKFVWPAGLLFNYPRWQIDAAAWWQYLFPAAVCAAVGALWVLRRRLGRGPLAAALCYLALLAPASGLLNVYPMRYAYVADHFAYLAGVPLIALAAAAWPSPWRASAAGRLPLVGAALALALLAALTLRRVPVFRDEEALWGATLAGNPASWLSANNLAMLRYREGRLSEALSLLRRAEALKPDEASVQDNIGLVLLAAGDADGALRHLGAAVRLEPGNALHHNNLGSALAAAGDGAGAAAAYRRALALKPDYAAARYNQALPRQGEGRVEEAIAGYAAALAADPYYADAHNNLGRLLVERGRIGEAVGHFEAALRERPDHAVARRNLETAREALRRAREGR